VSALSAKRQVAVGLLALALLNGANAFAASPVLNGLFPAGGQRGQTVAMKAIGSFAPWPPKAWVDADDIKIEPGKESGSLAVTIGSGALPGQHWLRLYNNDGASAPRPFVVGVLPEVAEVEPNDDPRHAQKLTPPASTINGRLGRSGDVDVFQIRLRKGQTVVAEVEAERTLGSPMDGVLQVTDAAGFVLAQNNDHRGLDPRLVFSAPREADYLVRLFAFDATPNSSIQFAGSEKYIYRLTITTGGMLDYAFPLAVAAAGERRVELIGWNLPEASRFLTLGPAKENFPREDVLVFVPEFAGLAHVAVAVEPSLTESEPNDPAHAQAIELPCVVSGRIAMPGDVDCYQFKARKGDRWLFRAASRALGFPLDPVLRLTNSKGKLLSRVDDIDKQADAELAFAVAADGEYRLTVEDLYRHGSSRHVYRLEARRNDGDFTLASAKSEFVLTAGKPLEIPVDVVRRGGLAEEIAIEGVDLPAGVSAKPVKSLAKGETAQSVKLVLTAERGPISGAFRIQGKTLKPAQAHFAQAGITGQTAKMLDIWLTVTASSTSKSGGK
jgi:hypothetical protein